MAMLDWNPLECHKCGDCGVFEGQLHEPGCDMERCPFCFGQLISCDCMGKMLDARQTKEASSDAETEWWWREVVKRGRVPCYIEPVLCARCGELWPDMFRADDWVKVIPATLRDKVLCRRCYGRLKDFLAAAV